MKKIILIVAVFSFFWGVAQNNEPIKEGVPLKKELLSQLVLVNLIDENRKVILGLPLKKELLDQLIQVNSINVNREVVLGMPLKEELSIQLQSFVNRKIYSKELK